MTTLLLAIIVISSICNIYLLVKKRELERTRDSLSDALTIYRKNLDDEEDELNEIQ